MLKEEIISDTLIKHYSDSGFLIRQIETGTLYGEAVDLRPCRYTYEETDLPENPEESEEPEEEFEETSDEIQKMNNVHILSLFEGTKIFIIGDSSNEKLHK